MSIRGKKLDETERWRLIERMVESGVTREDAVTTPMPAQLLQISGVLCTLETNHYELAEGFDPHQGVSLEIDVHAYTGRTFLVSQLPDYLSFAQRWRLWIARRMWPTIHIYWRTPRQNLSRTELAAGLGGAALAVAAGAWQLWKRGGR